MNKKSLHKKITHKSVILFTITVMCCFMLNTLYANNITNQSIAEQIKQKTVTLNIKNASIKVILDEIQKQSGFSFIFKNQGDIKLLMDLSLNVNNVSVEKALNMLFAKTNFTYSIIGETVSIHKRAVEGKKEDNPKISISGKVIDEDKKPISGATLIVLGTTAGAISDGNGEFTLTLKKGEKLETSFVGMISTTQVVNNETKDLIISLRRDVLAVDEIVVNGYFNKSKTSFTGAAKSFDKEDLRKVSNQNVLSALSMLDPSFKLIDNNIMGSDPNSIPQFSIRGGANFSDVVGDTKGKLNLPLFVLNGFVVPVQQIYDLDPNRVENMTILKDAAATAIYGSRASNGVVIVETVKLQKGKIRFTYTGDINIEMPDITCYNVLNSEEKLKYEVIAGLYKETGYPWFDESKRHLYNSRKKMVAEGYNTDWLNKPINSAGVGHKHSGIIEGGDDNFTYGMMLNYEDKVGVMKKSDRERLGLEVQLQYRYKNLKLRNELGFQRVTANNSPYGSFSTYVKMNPYYPYLEADGSFKKVLAYNYDINGEPTTPIVNPLYNGTLNAIDRNINDRLVNNFQFEWDILDCLKFKTQFSVSKEWGENDVYRSDKHTMYEFYDDEDLFRKGEYEKTNSSQLGYSFNAIGTFNKNFGENFISVNVGVEIGQDKNESMSYRVEGISDIAVNPSLALQYYPGSIPLGSNNEMRNLGVFANASYSWKNKYFIDGSYRTDGSSIYGKNNRWGGFWSAGMGWNLHKEDFLSSNEVVNLLKLRASTGITGSQNFSSFQALKTYQFLSSKRYGNWQGVDIMGIDNAGLKWQRNFKINIGVDFELFSTRLNGSIDIYNERSMDNLTSVSLPPSLGFTSYQDNMGNITNRGIELSVNYRYIDKKDFRSNVFVNIVRNVNKVTKLSDELVAFNKKQDAGVGNKPSVRYIEGKSANTLWVVPSLGIDPATGDELFLNRNGIATKKWSALDYVAMGSTDPKIEGTIGNSLSYKSLQLNIFLSYRFGANLYNETLVDKVENSDPNSNVDRRAFDQGWQKPGDVSFYKRPGAAKTEPTSRFIENENYLKLGSVNISYYLPVKFCTKLGMESAKFTVFMNDIATWSSVKQERGTSYPFARNVSASLQLTF